MEFYYLTWQLTVLTKVCLLYGGYAAIKQYLKCINDER
ncbi:hypothetical protein PALI_a0878 [Pseudoalteromonas aliena SW19]|uniref:Uncharacterized protein n=1 Tax=Pseudoalteromonas aliena SW19 TaxID=1314866 RepID=A0ABR9DZ29_9GAMM|nr:hypothetical protein [Pseudoalteromonas aliena SW19]